MCIVMTTSHSWVIIIIHVTLFNQSLENTKIDNSLIHVLGLIIVGGLINSRSELK